MSLNFQELQYFRAVVEHCSISKAAKFLKIRQPSLSQSIKKLEAEVNTSLFIRSSKGVVLTRSGERLFAHSTELMQMWSATRQVIKDSEFEVAGDITLGCYPSVGVLTFPMFLPQLRQKYPGVNIHLEHKRSPDITQDVVSSKVDIGLVANPIQHPSLIMFDLYTDLVSLWKSKQQTPLNTPNSKESVLFVVSRIANSAWLHEELERNDLNFANVIVSDSLEVISRIVATGGGVGILPQSIATLTKEYQLEPVLQIKGYQDKMYLIYREENRKYFPIRAIGSFISDRIREGMTR